MSKTSKIIVSIAVSLLLAGVIVILSVHQKGGEEKKSPFVRSFTDENFASDVLEASAKQPVLVDFFAEWCVPCRMLDPVLEELARELQGKVIVGRVDTDRNMVSRKLGITRIPAVWIIKDGQIKTTFYGVVPKETILAAIKDLGS